MKFTPCGRLISGPTYHAATIALSLRLDFNLLKRLQINCQGLSTHFTSALSITMVGKLIQLLAQLKSGLLNLPTFLIIGQCVLPYSLVNK